MNFEHLFADGAKATMTVLDEPPKRGESHIQKIEWSDTEGTAAEHLKEYIKWINEVNQSLADKWQIRMMHMYQIGEKPDTWQAWLYVPGEKPELVDLDKL